MFYSDGHINKTSYKELRFIMQNIIISKCAFQSRQISKMIGQSESTFHVTKMNALYEKITFSLNDEMSNKHEN